MSNVCQVCQHKDRLAIDRKIVLGGVLTELASEFGVEYHNLWQHAHNHVTKQLAQAMEKKSLIQGNELLDIVTKIIQRADDIFTRNYNAKRDDMALKALSEQRNTIQLLSNISAQLHSAKMAELELQERKKGDNEEQRKTEYVKNLSILSIDELKVYERLQYKVFHQNADKIISNGRVLVKNTDFTNE